MAYFQPRPLTDEQKTKLDKAEKEVEEAKETLNEWSGKVAKETVESERTFALGREAHFNSVVDRALATLRELKQEFGQIPGPGYAHAGLEQSEWRIVDPEVGLGLIKEELAKLSLPLNPEAYEFRDLIPVKHLTDGSAIKGAFIDPTMPDMLVTNLHEPVVSLVELSWNNDLRRVSLTGPDRRRPSTISSNVQLSHKDYVVLVGASGAGKTRFLYERLYHQFGCLFIGAPDLGSNDLMQMLAALSPIMRSEEGSIVFDKLRLSMMTLLIIRAQVLIHLKSLFPWFEPRHWLAFQLYSRTILGIQDDIFVQIFLRLRSQNLFFGLDQGHLYTKSGLAFVAIDEAQVVNEKFLKNQFTRESGKKSGALGPLVDVVCRQNFGLVLSGTGLHIISAVDLLGSGVSKVEGRRLRIFGVTFQFSPETLEVAIRKLGYTQELDPYALAIFAGRPRFGMNLASFLLKGESWEHALDITLNTAREKISPSLDNVKASAEPNSFKMLKEELAFVASQQVLKGVAGIGAGGEVALEVGVCALVIDKPPERDDSKVGQSMYRINEPIILKIFSEWGSHLFLDLANEGHSEIGLLFESYVALNAKSIVSRIGGKPDFDGPWDIVEPFGDMRKGVQVANGEEVLWIKRLLDNAAHNTRGISMVFPGTAFGADIVVVARRSDGQRCIVFIQCKACMKFSTPDGFKSLQYLYHQNRGEKSQRVDEKYRGQLKELEEIMTSEKVSVVFVMFKYPANSQRGYPKATFRTHTLSVTSKKVNVLELVFDGANAIELLPEMKDGLTRLAQVKRLRATLHDDE